jgi:hypothetical protein
MCNYLAVRAIRIALFGAFVISLPFAWTFRSEHTTVADIVRYLPLLLLVLALIVGLVERIVREREGAEPKGFGLAVVYVQPDAAPEGVDSVNFASRSSQIADAGLD